jgi:O-antigen ligase
MLVYLLLFLPAIRHVPRAWSRWHAGLLCVFGMGLAVALVRTHHVTSYALINKMAGLLFLLLSYAALVGRCADRRAATRLLGAFVVGVTVQSAVAVVAYLFQVAGLLVTNAINFEGARVSGLLIDPNAFGGIVAVAFTLHLWSARTDSPVWPWRRGSVVAGLTLLVALALTFSRSAWLAVVLVLLAAFLISGARGLRPFPKHHVVAIAAGVLVIIALKPGLLSLAVRPDQVSGRVGILSQAGHEFVGSPIVGIGLGTFSYEHGIIIHNTLAWLAAEMGLVALVVFAGLLLFYVRGLWRIAADVDAVEAPLAMAVLLAILAVLGLSLGIEALYQRYWWLLFAVAGGMFARQPEVRDAG